MNQGELLKYAVEHGMINMSYVQEQVAMNKREKMLKKHPYSVWIGERDRRWYTYLPSDKGGRELRSRSTEKGIQDLIVSYWDEESKNPTVKDIYDAWINDKLNRGEITLTTKNRYDRQYNESMKEFGKRKIKSIEEYDIEKFILNSICIHKLTAKGYGNLRTLIYGIFKRAKKEKLVSFSITSVVSDIEVSKKLFRKVDKRDDQLIFMDYEIPNIVSYFKNKELDIQELGIWLVFYTGMRPGELAGLKWEDVADNVIHIRRTEIKYEDKNHKFVYEVRNFPKTEAGIRDIVIPEDAKKILEMVRKLNPSGEYVFEKKGKRINTCMFDRRIRTICRKTNIVEKSLNKVRKTYGTILIDTGVDESLIISQMGHTDISTTKKYYYKNRKSQSKKVDIINKAFSEKNIGD